MTRLVNFLLWLFLLLLAWALIVFVIECGGMK